MADSFGIARFKWTGGRASWVVRSAIADGMERAAIYVKRTMRRLISIPYPPASRPGQSPRKRTGRLRNSIQFWINRQTLQVWIGPDESAVYGLYLEFGAPRAGLKKRPFIFKALKQEQVRVNNTINRAAASAFKKYSR